AGEFRVGYSGNMFDYSDMLRDLAQLAVKQTDVRIEFRGRPRWPQALMHEMTQRHLLHDFEPGPGFDDWLGSFDAYLAVMCFDAAIHGSVKFGYLVLRNVCRCTHHNSGTDAGSC